VITAWVDAPLLLSLLLAVLSRPVVHRLSPRTATPALVVAVALAALASTWGLLLLALTLVDDVPWLTHIPLIRALEGASPVPGVVADAAALVVILGLYRLGKVLRSHRLTNRAFRELCDTSSADELVVLADRAPHAVAVPGRWQRPGHIVVSSGMLSALDHDERLVLLAHERAHLRGRHHWHHVIVDAAAALNPLLSPTREAVIFLLERCADESAALAVGSRAVAARSLARAALASTATTTSTATTGPLAFDRLNVTERVVALRAPAPPERTLVAVGVVLLGLCTTLAAGGATVSCAELFEHLLRGHV
jgi:energy-coupling factor transporter transmembrane protein EcfT